MHKDKTGNMRRKKIKSLLLSLIVFNSCLFLSENTFAAGSAHLIWNPNSEADLAGYKMYYDTSSHAGTCPSGYASSRDVGNATSHYFDALIPGQTYYFQMTAYDSTNAETACSTSPGEVSKLVTYDGDLDNNHSVNLSDASILAGDWGKPDYCAPLRTSDINRDCAIDGDDLAIMAGDYGSSF